MAEQGQKEVPEEASHQEGQEAAAMGRRESTPRVSFAFNLEGGSSFTAWAAAV